MSHNIYTSLLIYDIFERMHLSAHAHILQSFMSHPGLAGFYEAEQHLSDEAAAEVNRLFIHRYLTPQPQMMQAAVY